MLSSKGTGNVRDYMPELLVPVYLLFEAGSQ
jgi:hypothetical protein